MDADRFAGLTALPTGRVIYRTERRVVLTHSPTLYAKQQAGFDQTLAKATRMLGELAAICHDTWVNASSPGS